jgi:hypothetical protein
LYCFIIITLTFILSAPVDLFSEYKNFMFLIFGPWWSWLGTIKKVYFGHTVVNQTSIAFHSLIFSQLFFEIMMHGQHLTGYCRLDTSRCPFKTQSVDFTLKERYYCLPQNWQYIIKRFAIYQSNIIEIELLHKWSIFREFFITNRHLTEL